MIRQVRVMATLQKKLPVLALLLALAAPGGPAAAASCGNDGSGFAEWLDDFKQDAAAQGISQRTISTALEGLHTTEAS
jgi:membrane-bound lytic murein transglycosylase B